MSYRRSALVEKVTTPPIADAQRWVTRTHGTPAQTLLDVSQAVPSYPPAPRLRAHLANTATQAETAFYTDICGLPALRKQLARSIADECWGRIDAEQINITSGCNRAFCVAIDSLTQPRDEIILPLPYYFNHHMWLEIRGVTPVFLPFAEEHLPPGTRFSPFPARCSDRTSRTISGLLLPIVMELSFQIWSSDYWRAT